MCPVLIVFTGHTDSESRDAVLALVVFDNPIVYILAGSTVPSGDRDGVKLKG